MALCQPENVKVVFWGTAVSTQRLEDVYRDQRLQTDELDLKTERGAFVSSTLTSSYQTARGESVRP